MLILAEIFGVKLSDVDETIENRFQAGNEVERWPRKDEASGALCGWVRPASSFQL